MSFFGKLFGGIGKAAEVASSVAGNPMVAGLITTFLPAAGPILAITKRVAGAVQNVEAAHAAAGKEHSGAEKFSFVQADFEAGLDIANIVANGKGKSVVYDKEALKEVINCQVAAMNAAKKLYDSIKEVDMVGTPAPTATPLALPPPQTMSTLKLQ